MRSQYVFRTFVLFVLNHCSGLALKTCIKRLTFKAAVPVQSDFRPGNPAETPLPFL